MENKKMKYTITDCENNKPIEVNQERFIAMVTANIIAYVDCCNERDVIEKFTELATSFIKGENFSLDINGYLFEKTSL